MSHLRLFFLESISLKLSCTKLYSQPIYLTFALFLLLKDANKDLILDWVPRILDNIFQFAFVVSFLRKSAHWHNFWFFTHFFIFKSFILVYVRAQSLITFKFVLLLLNHLVINLIQSVLNDTLNYLLNQNSTFLWWFWAYVLAGRDFRITFSWWIVKFLCL